MDKIEKLKAFMKLQIESHKASKEYKSFKPTTEYYFCCGEIVAYEIILELMNDWNVGDQDREIKNP